MISRHDLNSFLGHRHYPSVSILAPTHRTAPLNKQDPIKVKNLVRKAIEEDLDVHQKIAAVLRR
jgi:hypothetical protein